MLVKENAHKSELIFYGKNRHYRIFYFYCVCGNELRVQCGSLKRHSGKCRSCSQKGIPYKYIYNELIRRKNKKYSVELTFEEFLEIISVGKCHYCGREAKYNKYTRDENRKHVSRAHKLDRKDNFLGYTKDNCVVCCWDCNRIKSNIYSYEEFMMLSPILKTIYKNRSNVSVN